MGGTLNLTASTVVGATNCNLTGPNGFISNVQNPTVSSSATLAMAGTYSVWVTGASGLNSATNTTTVTVNNPGSTPPVFTGISVSGTSLTLAQLITFESVAGRFLVPAGTTLNEDVSGSILSF